MKAGKLLFHRQLCIERMAWRQFYQTAAIHMTVSECPFVQMRKYTLSIMHSFPFTWDFSLRPLYDIHWSYFSS